MEPPEDTDGRSFVEVISEKYSPENFPYCRGPVMGVVVVPTTGLQGSPMKGAREGDFLLTLHHSAHQGFLGLAVGLVQLVALQRKLHLKLQH